MNGRASSETSNLLIPGHVLLLLPRLVPLIGLNGAIVLQQIRYLTVPPRGIHDGEGRCWVRLSYAEWQEAHFPFWKIDTVKRAFQGLEEEGLLLAERTYATPRDQTKSYAINYARLADLERAFRAATQGTTHVRARRRHRSAGAGGPAADDRSLPASNLLLDDNPLVIIPQLAVLLGLDEALVLQQVRYWLADDRRPHFHEGHRWVRFTQEEWARQIPRSLRTLGTVFRKLESQGYLISTTRLNTIPGDQTKWYTIDVERLQALDVNVTPAPPPISQPAASPRSRLSTPQGNCAPIHQARMRVDGDELPIGTNRPHQKADSHEPIGNVASHQSAILHLPVGNDATTQTADLPRSIQGIETRTKINENEIQQQERNTPSSSRPSDEPLVVVASRSRTSIDHEAEHGARSQGLQDKSSLVKALVERGITGTVAVRLTNSFPQQVGHQMEIYDWLCEKQLDNERLTPGRLRRMIEEDWAPPPGFVPAAERARRAVEAATAEESRRRQLEIERQVGQERERTYAAQLAAVDITTGEQGSWRIVLDRMDRRRGGARFFAGTLFRESRGDDPAVVIFRDPRAIEVLDSPAGRAAFDELAHRLAERYPRAGWPNPTLVPAVVLYDDLARALAAAGITGPSAETNIITGANASGVDERVGDS